ncbi:unnamed protein product [Brachionus calyciflorus]|uniref:EGF-like domain-containing protein n=1 Tax=Brachionus calyciflorus TaxID=104777 RepID=A0A813WAX6_9BILA|nr:unnamed protein product [Brachionus calyciflorus]
MSWNNFVYEFETNVQCSVLSFELISNGNLACGYRDVSSLIALETQFLVSGDTDGTLNIRNHITGSKTLSYRAFLKTTTRTILTSITTTTSTSRIAAASTNKIAITSSSPTTIGSTSRTTITSTCTIFLTNTKISRRISNSLTTKICPIIAKNENDLVNILSSRTDSINCLTNCSNYGEYRYDFVLDKFICACRENYYGSSCKFNLRPCSLNPCLNNGNCSNININGSLNYKCQCFDGFSGRNCEFKKEICSPEICSNKGYCYYSNQNPKCKCFYLYGGDKCEIELNDLKIIRIVIRTSSIIAVLIIFIIFGLLVINDILSFCCGRNSIGKKKTNRRGHSSRVKLVYINN